MRRPRHPQPHRDAFTLIELMIAVAILGILSAIAIPKFKGYLIRSRQAEVYLNFGSIDKAEMAYFDTNGIFTANLRAIGANNFPDARFLYGFDPVVNSHIGCGPSTADCVTSFANGTNKNLDPRITPTIFHYLQGKGTLYGMAGNTILTSFQIVENSRTAKDPINPSQFGYGVLPNAGFSVLASGNLDGDFWFSGFLFERVKQNTSSASSAIAPNTVDSFSRVLSEVCIEDGNRSINSMVEPFCHAPGGAH